MNMIVVVSVVVIPLAMAVVARPMRMPVPPKYEVSNNVRCQARGADGEDELGVCDLGRVDEPAKRFQNDRDTERNQEHCVEKSSEDLGSLPLKVYLSGGFSSRRKDVLTP